MTTTNRRAKWPMVSERLFVASVAVNSQLTDWLASRKEQTRQQRLELKQTCLTKYNNYLNFRLSFSKAATKESWARASDSQHQKAFPSARVLIWTIQLTFSEDLLSEPHFKWPQSGPAQCLTIQIESSKPELIPPDNGLGWPNSFEIMRFIGGKRKEWLKLKQMDFKWSTKFKFWV